MCALLSLRCMVQITDLPHRHATSAARFTRCASIALTCPGLSWCLLRSSLLDVPQSIPSVLRTFVAALISCVSPGAAQSHTFSVFLLIPWRRSWWPFLNRGICNQLCSAVRSGASNAHSIHACRPLVEEFCIVISQNVCL